MSTKAKALESMKAMGVQMVRHGDCRQSVLNNENSWYEMLAIPVGLLSEDLLDPWEARDLGEGENFIRLLQEGVPRKSFVWFRGSGEYVDVPDGDLARDVVERMLLA